jgi:hypothetical protein
VSGEDWRVEVELDDERHGYSVGERLRALDLDDEARKRLGKGAVVTRDGSKLFVYTRTPDEADEAARVLREFLAAEGLTAEIRATRWHPAEEAWEDVSVPMPETDADRERERAQRDERERREVAAGGEYDWQIHVRAADRAGAEELERRLLDEGLPVERRWRYLTIEAITQEEANELASRIQEQLPQAEVAVEANELTSPPFVLIRRWL